MSSVAIIGPGAIGGTIAAHLFATGVHTVTLCVRTPFDSLEVGLPDGTTLRANPRVLLSPVPLSSPPDWLLVTTKAYDVAGAAAWIRALAGPATRVAILQNGVEHIERFKPHVALERLLPVMVDLPAERDGPGRIRQRGRSVFRVPSNELGREFLRLLDGTGFDAATSEDFLSVLWRKLALNAPGAVNALLLQPTGIVRDDAIADLMRGMILEVIAVARAEGAQLDESLADRIIENQRKAPVDGVNSLHADRLAGRTMEVDARNGAVVRAGLRHGIPTPLNTMALTLLNALQPTAPVALGTTRK
jgi:2-dehydropantoate 2-reductase